MERISLEAYFTKIAQTVALRSTCPRATVGAVIVEGGTIVSTGYNGSPSGFPHCSDIGCIIINDHCIASVHAEQNAIIQAKGRGAELYCTHLPCIECCKLIVTAKIYRVHYDKFYYDGKSQFFHIADQREYLEQRGVSILKFSLKELSDDKPTKDV